MHGTNSFAINKVFETNDPVESCEVERFLVILLGAIENGLNTRIPSRHNTVNGKTQLSLGQENYANSTMDKAVHTFIHRDGRVERMTKSEFYRLYRGDRSDIRRMFSNKILTVNGWRLDANKDIPYGTGNCYGRLKRVVPSKQHE